MTSIDNRNLTFCSATTGDRCQHRMLRIPYKPLSERVFEEPFWLGLMTVAVVMGCIGVIFCIKKHFADKIEKFFAEEIERSKYGEFVCLCVCVCVCVFYFSFFFF
ncbi:hypothetical protein E2C01_075389 [Portunus trituberculatus]|uniref:Uncharacterized protein n=1 Tax=Portunus trituberculatus TaxID=210409 RepID=A0A5B7IFQ0_PORTR|nr:hypothetical protein [Portunus trituberculatus]